MSMQACIGKGSIKSRDTTISSEHYLQRVIKNKPRQDQVASSSLQSHSAVQTIRSRKVRAPGKTIAEQAFIQKQTNMIAKLVNKSFNQQKHREMPAVLASAHGCRSNGFRRQECSHLMCVWVSPYVSKSRVMCRHWS